MRADHGSRRARKAPFGVDLPPVCPHLRTLGGVGWDLWEGQEACLSVLSEGALSAFGVALGTWENFPSGRKVGAVGADPDRVGRGDGDQGVGG